MFFCIRVVLPKRILRFPHHSGVYSELKARVSMQEVQARRFTEDLLATNSKLDQLRNESANLRAEKKIWEVR